MTDLRQSLLSSDVLTSSPISSKDASPSAKTPPPPSAEANVYPDIFVHHHKLDSVKAEQIWIADLPYNLQVFGNQPWNQAKDILSRYAALLKNRFSSTSGQSLTFCSWEQATALQKLTGGKILWAIESSPLHSPSKGSPRIMNNRVQSAVYTKWGHYASRIDDPFDGNVLEYSFLPNERIQDNDNTLANPGQKAQDLITQILQALVHYSDHDSPHIVDVCSGTGTTAAAALLLDLNCSSFESDVHYRTIIQRRLHQVITDHKVRRGAYVGEMKQRELVIRHTKEAEVGDERFHAVIAELEKLVPDLLNIPDHGFSRESKLPPFKLIPRPDAQFRPCKPYKTSFKENEYIVDQFDAMDKAGIVSRSSSNIVSPVFCVPKPPNLLRMVVNYKRVDKQLLHSVNVLPNPEVDIFTNLHGCKYFSAIDLTTGYYSVAVDPKSRKYTAVVLRDGRVFEFNRMPMGFANAPHHFQTALTEAFKAMPFCHIYLDDAIVASRTFEEHVEHLKQVFRKLDELGLTVALYKCQFGLSKITYLGYEISAQGITMKQEKQVDIASLSPPSSVSDVRSVLGKIGFYRRFIPHFADKTYNLTQLLRSDVPFTWSDTLEAEFNSLKQAAQSRLSLKPPDYTRPFIIHADASDVALGGALLQRDPVTNALHPVSFTSRKFTSAERNYTITERELLAIVECLIKWRHYVHLTPFEIHTDHKALTYFDRLDSLSGRLARWQLFLQSFNYSLHFIKGTDNDWADFWSREGVDASIPDRLSDEQIQHDLASIRGSSVDEFIQRFVYAQTRAQTRASPPTSFQQLSPVSSDIRPPNWKDWIWFAHQFGHYGAAITTQRLRNVIQWPKMEQDVQELLRSCHICHLHNHHHLKPHFPLHLRPEASVGPMEEIEVDFIEHLPDHPLGYTSIFSIVDRFSRYVMFIPLVSSSAAEAAVALWSQWITRFGFPIEINSDRGAAFVSALFTEFTKILGINQRFSVPYVPRGHGSIEIQHKVMNAQLRKSLPNDNWDLKLPLIAYNMNTSTSSATGFSPFELIFGRNPSSPRMDKLTHSDRWQFVAKVLLSLAKARSLKARANMKLQYDKRAQLADPQKIKVGSLVYVSRPPRQRQKYSRLFDGPFLIHEVRMKLKEVILQHPLSDIVLPTPVSFERLKVLHLNVKDYLTEAALDQDEFEVANIIDHKVDNDTLRYLVEFVGYPEPEWISAANCDSCPQVVADYWASQS